MPLLDDPEPHRSRIDAFERMQIPESTDALARRSANGDALATRALARLRDPRALEPVLALLADPDPAVAFRGADGLRDLRDPAATDALLAADDHPDPDVAVCAAHPSSRWRRRARRRQSIVLRRTRMNKHAPSPCVGRESGLRGLGRPARASGPGLVAGRLGSS